MRPDIALTAGHLGAGAGMDDDEGVHEAVAVIIVGREIDAGVGGSHGVARHGLRIGHCSAHARGPCA